MAISVRKMLAEIRAQHEYAANHQIEVLHKAPPAEFPDGNHKFVAHCSCGWQSIARLSAAAGAQSGIHHVWSITTRDRPNPGLNGVSVPRIVSGLPQDQSTG